MFRHKVCENDPSQLKIRIMAPSTVAGEGGRESEKEKERARVKQSELKSEKKSLISISGTIDAGKRLEMK